MTARAYTEEEIRTDFMNHLRNTATYWATQHGKTQQERCEGVAFSILSMIDGCSMALPAFTISVDPHPDDKAFHIKNGDNWYEPGTIITSESLHELFYKR